MIADAFLLADPYLKISDSVQNPEEYVHLTDCVLRKIEESKIPVRSDFMCLWFNSSMVRRWHPLEPL